MNKRIQKILMGSLTAAVIATSGVTAGAIPVSAATEHFNDASEESTAWENWKANWDTFSSNYERVSLTPGEDQTQLNYAWYCKTQGETPQVKISTNEDMSDAQTFSGTQSDAVVISDVQYYSNKVTVTGLEEKTQYYYQVYQDGEWQDVQNYSTKSFSDYSFLYVGDPQIGASKGQTDSEGDKLNAASKGTTVDADADLAARNDSYNWNKVLKGALKFNSNVSFMVSAGDQVNYSENEREYSSYLGADALTSLPVATTIGNHDSTSSQYTMHYNNPNAFSDTDTEYTEGKTAAGTDYYYTYGNTLFIVLDTNNYNCATHENVIKKATEENPDAKWRVVTFHQDIYGSGADHSDSDGIVLRTQLTPIMDKYDIDVVLQGHDHTYSRTYQLQGDGEEHTAYTSTLAPNASEEDKTNYSTQNNCYDIVDTTAGGTVVNPEGTVYLEANSATGSKYYNLIATQQDYISERSQTWTPTYSVVDVTDESFSVTVYDSTTNRQLEGSSTYTIEKKEKVDQEVSAKAENTSLAVGDTTNISTSGQGTITYTSSNTDIAEVSSDGQVTAKSAGTTEITVNAAGNNIYKEGSTKVTITVVPTTPEITKASNVSGRKMTVKWSKNSDINGYQIYYDTTGSKHKTATVKGASAKSVTLKSLKKGKTYKVKIRSYKKVSGKYYYSAWSKTKSVKIKK